MEWTKGELDALQSVMSKGALVRVAIEKYCANKAASLQRDACNSLRSIPKQPDRASDQAAQADVFEQFVVTLERILEKSFVGPTD